MLAKKYLFAILMTLCVQLLKAQSSGPQLTGVVKDSDGKPLASVSVKLQKDNATFTTQTNADGQFILNNIPDGTNYKLVFTCIGFQPQVISDYHIVTGSITAVAVNMQPLSTALSQVVVVGYGKALNAEVSSAVTSIAPVDFNAGVIPSAPQLLQGRVAGLNIAQDGNPNSRAAIMLRGPSTLNLGQQPFYVIDDIPDADVNLIAPADIASIEVLKDADATAIYGNRAANGVILITTRKGSASDPKITYSNYAAIQKLSNYIDIATADELRAYLKSNNKSLAPNDDSGGNTNWQKAITRTGFAQNHNVGFSGGSNKFLYSGSLNYFDDKAIVKQSSLRRSAAALALNRKP